MRPLILLALLASLVATPAMAGTSTGQKALIVINDTPYDVVEFDLWMVGYGAFEDSLPYATANLAPNPVTSGVEAHQAVTAYVEETECFIHATAIASGGHIFSADLDICRGPALWVIQSTIRI